MSSEKTADISKLGASALQLTIAKIVTLCMTTVTNMVLVRYASVEAYGTYSEILLSVQLISVLFLFGVPHSVNFFLARAENDAERRVFLSTFLTIITVTGLLVGGDCGLPALILKIILGIIPWAHISIF